MAGKMLWIADYVEGRIAEAAKSLARLPQRGGPSRRTTMLIDYVHEAEDFWHAYGLSDATYMPERPTNEQIALMDETLAWLEWLRPTGLPKLEPPLPNDIARILWRRGLGWSWRRIQRARERGGYGKGGNSTIRIKSAHNAALDWLAARLNARNVPCVLPVTWRIEYVAERAKEARRD